MSIVLKHSSESKPERVDKVIAELAEAFPELRGVTRSRVKRLILEGKICVNGQAITKSGFLVEPGSVISISSIATEKEPSLEPCALPLSVIYEDKHLVVIDKQAGLTVHPAPGTGNLTLINAVTARFGMPEGLGATTFRPGVVHRLDKDTTGLLVVARTEQALSALGKQFQERTVHKVYTAIASIRSKNSPLLLHDRGTIDTPIGRHPKHRTMMAVLPEGGRQACTEWTVVERGNGAALLRVSILTGRTHQIRVHLQSIGCPVVGDPVYGDNTTTTSYVAKQIRLFGRQALHASELEFSHPETSERRAFASAPPRDFRSLWSAFKAGKS